MSKKAPKKRPSRQKRVGTKVVRRVPPPGIPPLPPAFRGQGAKGELSPAVIETLCGFVEETNSVDDAALLAGFHATTVYKWIAKGRKATDGIYKRLFDALEEAKARRRLVFHRSLKTHYDKSHQAIIQHAERTDPKHFALRVHIQVQEELENALAVFREGLPPDQYETLCALLSRNAGGAGLGEDSGGEGGEDGEAGDNLGATPAVTEAAEVPESPR